jgi:hypothetical protein
MTRIELWWEEWKKERNLWSGFVALFIDRIEWQKLSKDRQGPSDMKAK